MVNTPEPRISNFFIPCAEVFSSNLVAISNIIILIGTFTKNKNPQFLSPNIESIPEPKVGPTTVAIPYTPPIIPRAEPLFSTGNDVPMYAVAIGIIPPPPIASITLENNKNV